ncbi:MAG: nucleotidyltransferase domain-containing protein [Bacillota bacterium]|nr:nucleotidyltransferase domain-containing protein [Bacillota bacterium]
MMRFGLTQDTLKQIINNIAKNQKVEEAILFGSRAMGNYTNGSDIDLALKGEDLDMDDLLKMGIILDELDLPYHVDLLVFEKIENRDLIDHIRRVGETIFSR